MQRAYCSDRKPTREPQEQTPKIGSDVDGRGLLSRAVVEGGRGRGPVTLKGSGDPRRTRERGGPVVGSDAPEPRRRRSPPPLLPFGSLGRREGVGEG